MRESAGAPEGAAAGFGGEGLFGRILDALPNVALVLDGDRRVIYANEPAIERAGLDLRSLVGLRPGDYLSCVHATEGATGCGGSEACRVCGAYDAILEAQRGGGKASREFRVEVGGPGERKSHDFLVTASSIHEAGGSVLVLSLEDVSDRKRREALERIFFHDVLNSITILRSSASLLEEEYGSDDYIQYIVRAAESLQEEVLRQRDLRSMERGELKVEFQPGESLGLVREAVASIRRGQFALGKEVRIGEESVDRVLVTDGHLLRRVLVNMLKNALEATDRGGGIAIETRPEADGILFAVWNPAWIPVDDQLQVFRRSFSTKGEGRGLGTYSMRLLVENYLGGRVGFESSPEEGTRFWIRLPLRPVEKAERTEADARQDA